MSPNIATSLFTIHGCAATDGVVPRIDRQFISFLKGSILYHLQLFRTTCLYDILFFPLTIMLCPIVLQLFTPDLECQTTVIKQYIPIQVILWMPNWVSVLNPPTHGQCKPQIGVDAHISVLNVYSQVLTVKQEAQQNMAKKKKILDWTNHHKLILA